MKTDVNHPMSTRGNRVMDLDTDNFCHQVLSAEGPVVVYFWASWSNACNGMMALLDAVADDKGLGVRVGRVSVEQHESLVEEYGVRAVPTVLFFHGGSMHERIQGRCSEAEIRERLLRL